MISPSSHSEKQDSECSLLEVKCFPLSPISRGVRDKTETSSQEATIQSPCFS